MDFYGFYTGKIFDAYKYLGAHVEEKGVTFRTFAPSASRITLIGEFNDWQEWEMNKVSDGNFWECYVPQAKAGQMYKYKIYDRNGNPVDHCDPYGFGMELRPSSASIIRDMSKYKFKDSQWLQNRSDCRKKPLNIYEIHFGSFRKPSDKADDWYNYEEMIDILIPYLVKNGYNYLEIMPLNEYPCDESWGYQATGFFSPTSRYGTADQLKAFIDACHKHNIGVLMDFVPVHFAVDAYGLANYDGTALYEYPNSAVGVSEWGSCNFMHSRGETRSFLQSCANYWISEFHMDGIRCDVDKNITAVGMNDHVDLALVHGDGNAPDDLRRQSQLAQVFLDLHRRLPRGSEILSAHVKTESQNLSHFAALRSCCPQDRCCREYRTPRTSVCRSPSAQCRRPARDGSFPPSGAFPARKRCRSCPSFPPCG